MERNEIGGIIESILFVSGEPVAVGDLCEVLGLPEDEIHTVLDEYGSTLDYERRGIRLLRFGSHVQLATRPEYAPYVERLLQPVQRRSLTQAAMETLAVVAYKQPVTRAEVEAIRGVKCDYSIHSLAQKQLIIEVGRKDALGRPVLYGTTDEFLRHFGIASLEELPSINFDLLVPQVKTDDSEDMADEGEALIVTPAHSESIEETDGEYASDEEACLDENEESSPTVEVHLEDDAWA